MFLTIEAVNRDCHNILKLFGNLLNFALTTSETA